MIIRNLTDADYSAALENWAKAQGAVRQDLHVWDFNRDALALYQAMGMDFQYHVMEKKL